VGFRETRQPFHSLSLFALVQVVVAAAVGIVKSARSVAVVNAAAVVGTVAAAVVGTVAADAAADNRLVIVAPAPLLLVPAGSIAISTPFGSLTCMQHLPHAAAAAALALARAALAGTRSYAVPIDREILILITRPTRDLGHATSPLDSRLRFRELISSCA
jgi:hypothetical protein